MSHRFSLPTSLLLAGVLVDRAAARRRPHSSATSFAVDAGRLRLRLNRRHDCSPSRTSVWLEPLSATSASPANQPKTTFEQKEYKINATIAANELTLPLRVAQRDLETRSSGIRQRESLKTRLQRKSEVVCGVKNSDSEDGDDDDSDCKVFVKKKGS
ncbi:hypothetical protein Syun_001626 [Stephania yunnanensis]|uniref:Uncharacterized protein n=1 Tax=Stephania yunnanensis TaxID=152371 RepID=A0AAP0LEH6_9MAGN